MNTGIGPDLMQDTRGAVAGMIDAPGKHHRMSALLRVVFE
jgi:hypothetical protein